jgi:hypothetical protein
MTVTAVRTLNRASGRVLSRHEAEVCCQPNLTVTCQTSAFLSPEYFSFSSYFQERVSTQACKTDSSVFM